MNLSLSGRGMKPTARAGKAGKGAAKKAASPKTKARKVPGAKTSGTGAKTSGTKAAKSKSPVTGGLKVGKKKGVKKKKAVAKTADTPQKKQEKKEEVKTEEPKKEEPPAEDVHGKVIIRWNHYERELAMVNGVLNYKAFDEHFCLSFVYKEARYHLCKDKFIHSGHKYTYAEETKPNEYKGLEDGETYWVHIEESAEELEKQANAPPPKKYVPNEADDFGGEKAKVHELTQQLKGLSAEQLRTKGPEYKALIEARDLEDCLFSGV